VRVRNEEENVLGKAIGGRWMHVPAQNTVGKSRAREEEEEKP
jgi:hypothetical protein